MKTALRKLVSGFPNKKAITEGVHEILDKAENKSKAYIEMLHFAHAQFLLNSAEKPGEPGETTKLGDRSLAFLLEAFVRHIYKADYQISLMVQRIVDEYLQIFKTCFEIDLSELNSVLYADSEKAKVVVRHFKNVKYITDDKTFEVTGYLSGIYAQLDPDVDRVTFDSATDKEVTDELQAELMVSMDSGALFFTRTCMTFTTSFSRQDNDLPAQIHVSDANERIWLVDEGLKIRYQEISLYQLEIVDHFGQLAHQFALSIYCGTREKIAFYPLREEDLAPVIKHLLVYLGKKPTKSKDIVKEILTQKLVETRATILGELLKQKNPWIEHYDDLKSIIRNLMKTSQPQSMYEMERLYHSCRREMAVTKEAISLLQFHWSGTISEAVRHRVMSILDRLLQDTTIVPTKSKEFDTVFKWLSQIEENLNPYKSPEALYFVTTLLERMRSIRNTSLETVSAPFLHFENWATFEFLSREYTEFSTRALWK